MNKPSNEQLLTARLELEKDKELFPQFRALIDNQIKNVEKIMKEKGVIIILLFALWIWYMALIPPMEFVVNEILPYFE